MGPATDDKQHKFAANNNTAGCWLAADAIRETSTGTVRLKSKSKSKSKCEYKCEQEHKYERSKASREGQVGRKHPATASRPQPEVGG